MMYRNDWITPLITLGFGIGLIAIAAFIVAISNPMIDAKCAAKGGQVLHTPGHLNSCLYPAK